MGETPGKVGKRNSATQDGHHQNSVTDVEILDTGTWRIPFSTSCLDLVSSSFPDAIASFKH